MADEVSSQAESTPAEPISPQQEAAQEAPELETAQIPESEPLAHEPEPTPTPTPSAPSPAVPVISVIHVARDLLVKARATIQFRKLKKLEKILSAVSANGKISNDEVEKLLHVSDATASRYVSTLVKQGKLKQVGKTGKAVTYTKA